jgi:hypothetical protein
MKLAPGLSLNVSKKGLGLSAGPKGVKASLSSQGRLTGSVGIPGSGVSYRGALNSNAESELGESEDNSLLLSIADNAAYISIHGPVMSGSEMRRALLLLATSTLSLVVYILTSFGTPLGFGLNPFLYIYIGLVIGYLRESKKNKELVKVRKIEHLKDCAHLEKIDEEVIENPLFDQLTKLSELFKKGLIDEAEYKGSKAKILGLK